MLKFFKYKWAVDGETTAVPNAVDPSGYVSYRQGYGADYSRVYGTDPLAKAPERVKLNAVLQDITAELQSLQVHGFPDYITSALNDGVAYAYDIGAIVRWTDNKNYRNTVAENTDDPSVSGWVLYNDPSDAINSAPAKTTPDGDDKIGIWDSVTGLLNSISLTALSTYLTGLFAPIDSPAFTTSATLDGISLGRSFKVTDVSASGTAIDFTGLPEWAKRITVMFNGISTNGTSAIQIQLGTSGGVKTTGYSGGSFNFATDNNISSGIPMHNSAVAGTAYSGAIDVLNFSGNTFVAKGNLTQNATGSGTGNNYGCAGSVTLSATLDRVRITTVNGTDVFDAGSINILVEG